MKGFWRKYTVYLSVPIIIIVAIGVASVFSDNYILFLPLYFCFFFLPVLAWCVHAWEKKQMQNNPQLWEKKEARFWFKFRSLFILQTLAYGPVYGMMGVSAVITLIYPSALDKLNGLAYIIGFPSYALYTFCGVYIFSIFIGIHLIRKKKMSTKDIFFSIGLWFLLVAVYFGALMLENPHPFEDGPSLIVFFCLPVFGSTCILLFSEIITKSVLKAHK
ncbi:MAG TPA: hypothetical protein DEP42_00395 [Ruminococcaceae bacterium]|nr:hypothetical protein [Oscillospiraceae bacterium]